MALVEAVIGEALQQIEDRVGVVALDPALDRAGDEAAALGGHFLADLLAHGAPQQIRLAERIAGQNLRDLHHLFLIDDDAEGLLQHRLDLGVDVVGLFLAVLARVIGRDVGHRARPVERHQRDDVVEAVRPHLDQRPAHALTFDLEHPGGLAARQQIVGFLVVERQRVDVDLDAALGEQALGRLQHRQRLEPEEVELHQPRRLDPFHVELGHRHVRFRIAVERRQLDQRPVADHDAGGVRRGVAVEPLELERNIEQPRHALVRSRRFLQPRLALDGFREHHGRGRIVRHQLGELVDLTVGHFQHAPDVAQHGARLQRAEGDDLRHLVARRSAPARSGSLRRAGPGRSRCRSPASTRAPG